MAAVDEIRVIGTDAAGADAAGALRAHGGRIHVVASPGRSGFAAGANAGAAAAQGEFLLLLDPGVQPQPDLLDALVQHAERHPQAAVCGGKLLGPVDTIEQAGLVLDQQGYPRRLYAGLPATHAAANRTRRMQVASAACLLVRRDIFLDAGGFDTALEGDDAACDFCLRLGEQGHEVHYVPAAVGLWHAAALHRRPVDPRSRRLFRTRWVHKVRPDDVDCYQQDGLLRLQYEDGLPVRAVIGAPLEVARPPASDPGDGSERLLAARAHQVQALIEENARLADRVAALEAALPAGTRDDLVPPPDLERSVGGRFREVGEEFLAYFVDIGGLRPTDRVLDVGCGVGRMAVPLTRYLTPPGSYDGFDVMPRAIAWCQTHVSTRFPHFRFHYVPLRNGSYNAQATAAAAAFQFPYPPDTFDFALLTSVFTHLLPDAAQHYIAQLATVLKPGGRCFATFFLINPESQGLIHAGLSPHFPFAHRLDGCRIADPKAPEGAVAYDEAQIRAWFDAAGLIIADPIVYGTWCGRADGTSLQDIVVAIKR